MAQNATAQSMVLNQPKIPLVPTTKEEDVAQVTLTRLSAGAGNEKRKAAVPWVQKEDVELILHLVKDFKDTWPASSQAWFEVRSLAFRTLLSVSWWFC